MKNKFSFFLSLVIIVIFWWLFSKYAINIPKWDDHAFKNFILRLNASPTLLGQLSEFIHQHNEHRVVLTRIVTWFDYKIFGVIDYTHLMIFGNLSLLGIWGLFSRFFVGSKNLFFYALPAVFCWFSLAFYDNIFWGMASIQNFWIVALAMLVCWLLAQNTQNLRLVFLVVVLAAYTSGNGLMLPFLGIFVLVLQKRWPQLKLWSVATLLLIIAYFSTYTRPPVVATTPKDLLLITKGYLCLLGSFFEAIPFGNSPVNKCLVFGVILLIFSILFLIKLLKKLTTNQLTTNDYYFIGLMAFAFGTLILVAYSRVDVGLDGLLVSRYKVYSALIFCTLMMYSTTFITHKALPFFYIFINLFLYVANQHYYLQNTIEDRKYLTTSCFNWANDGASSRGKKNVIYSEPALLFDELRDYTADTAFTEQVMPLLNGNTLHFADSTFNEQKPNDDCAYIVLANQTNRYIFPMSQPRKHSIRNLVNYNTFFGNTAEANVLISQAYIKEGTYMVELYQHGSLIPLFQKVRIGNMQQKALEVNW